MAINRAFVAGFTLTVLFVVLVAWRAGLPFS
jgi:hypothetical protein